MNNLGGPSLTFDKAAKRFVLDAFDKTVDADGFIVEKANPSEKVLTPESDPITLSEFAGILDGSEIFVKKDIVSLISAADKLAGRGKP